MCHAFRLQYVADVLISKVAFGSGAGERMWPMRWTASLLSAERLIVEMSLISWPWTWFASTSPRVELLELDVFRVENDWLGG